MGKDIGGKMFCSKCGNDIKEENINFCPVCGEKISQMEVVREPMPSSEIKKNMEEDCNHMDDSSENEILGKTQQPQREERTLFQVFKDEFNKALDEDPICKKSKFARFLAAVWIIVFFCGLLFGAVKLVQWGWWKFSPTNAEKRQVIAWVDDWGNKYVSENYGTDFKYKRDEVWYKELNSTFPIDIGCSINDGTNHKKWVVFVPYKKDDITKYVTLYVGETRTHYCKLEVTEPDCANLEEFQEFLAMLDDPGLAALAALGEDEASNTSSGVLNPADYQMKKGYALKENKSYVSSKGTSVQDDNVQTETVSYWMLQEKFGIEMLDTMTLIATDDVVERIYETFDIDISALDEETKTQIFDAYDKMIVSYQAIKGVSCGSVINSTQTTYTIRIDIDATGNAVKELSDAGLLKIDGDASGISLSATATMLESIGYTKTAPR